ncbi:MAG: nucleotide-binding protein [Deltaproteobacteria bacterium]|nr:MAG: nucleotide-binding protein [Deltaproteobacteria bacterium]
MKKHFIVSLAVLALAIGCQDKAPKTEEPPVQEKSVVDESGGGGFSGTVAETIKVERYTYVQVDTGTEKIWAATSEFHGKVGDTVVVPDGLVMKNFHSNTLKRDFELVYFVGPISGVKNDRDIKQRAEMPSGHPPMGGKSSKPQIDLSKVKKAKEGKTVAEIFAGKEDLAGKQVLVRGKVVKFLPQIMGKNWLHLQDGSGSEGTNDLTITTNAMAKVGDLVLVSGKVTVNRDFGYGYSYEVLLEDAKITVE